MERRAPRPPQHALLRPTRRQALLGLGAATIVAGRPADAAPSLKPLDWRYPTVIDTAWRLDAAKAAELAARGVKTVIRYYSHLPANIPGKELEPEERDIVFDAGMSLAVVFQHYNQCFLTFSNHWGREDAMQALRQAAAVGQPEGSAIYFSVDGDWPFASTMSKILAYFEDVARTLEGSGYHVGVYGNGCANEEIRKRGLVRYHWLSASTAHTGTQAFYNEGAWALYQNVIDIETPGITPIDTNVVNPAMLGYFGQFDARGAETARHPNEQIWRVFDSRRFIARSSTVRDRPSSAARTLGAAQRDWNIRVLREGAGWTEIETNEGGRHRSRRLMKGFVETDRLRSLDAFPDLQAGFGACNAARQPTSAQLNASCRSAGSRRRA